MKLCIHCTHPVSRGDRHAVSQCPPPRGRRGQHRSRRRRPVVECVERGAAIAGTGKPSASSKATGKGK